MPSTPGPTDAGAGRRPGQEVRILDVEADAGKGLGLFDDLCGYRSGRAGFKRADVARGTEYLIPAVTWAGEVCRGLNVKAVSALLLARGHLVPDHAGKCSRAETLPGLGKVRCYVVNQSIFGGPDA